MMMMMMMMMTTMMMMMMTTMMTMMRRAEGKEGGRGKGREASLVLSKFLPPLL